MVRDLRQEICELVEHVDDTVLTKQIGVVNYGELNAAIDFRRVKHDVELRFGSAEGQSLLICAASELQNTLRGVGHIEHDLKQGIAAEVSLRIDFFDDLFQTANPGLCTRPSKLLGLASIALKKLDYRKDPCAAPMR